MTGTVDGMPVATPDVEPRPGGSMHSVILKLEADVEARKKPRSELWPALRLAALLTAVSLTAYDLGARSVDTSAGWTARVMATDRLAEMTAKVDELQGQLDFQRVQLERMQRAHRFSTRYRISADLAMAIEETALAENVDPALAFELVRVESEFNPRAVSPVGAVGFTQVMPATARLMVPGITREQLFNRETNLRLGFRFLRQLVNHYNGDMRLALLAYNRGPETVDRLLRAGVDPANGYSKLVLGR